MHALGVLDGQWDNSNCTNTSLVVLDFGQPALRNGVYGTNAYDGATFHSLSEIDSAAYAYADGWWPATGSCPRLRFAVGTNNGGECPTVPNYGETSCDLTQWGNSWVDTVYYVDQYLIQRGYSWQISVAGADDMETEWDHYDLTNQVVTGFNNGAFGSSYIFYDFGDATPGNEYYWIGSQRYDNWTQPHIWQVAWGAPLDVPLPEIYTDSQSSDWEGVELNAGSMTIWGTMSECADAYNFPIIQQHCSSPSGLNAPYRSWNDMLAVQSRHGWDTNIFYATNIKH
jgi:hypothetical protein